MFDDESQSPIEAAATAMSTRFSSANKMLSKEDTGVDLRKLSLVDQQSIEMDEKPFTELGTEEESISSKEAQDSSLQFDDVNYSDKGADGAPIDQKINSEHENRSNVQKEFNYQYNDHELQSILHDNNLTENVDGVCQDFKLRNPDVCNTINTPIKTSFKPSKDVDNIQVKDIWKALVDSGYDISREEVSKYKVNTTKSPARIKSAPARWRSSQTNCFSKNIPRSRSAYGGKGSESLQCPLEDVSVSGKSDSFSEEEGNLRENSLSSKANIEVVAQKKSLSKLPRLIYIPFVFKLIYY